MDVLEKISAPARAEDEVRRKQGQLLEALRIARLAYWEYDVPNDEFIFNDEFYSLLRTTAEREGGYTMSSGQYAKRFVHPDDMSLVETEIQKTLAATDPNYSRQLDHRIIYADGQVGYFNVNIRVEKDTHGRTIKTHGANMDISDRKRVEEELRRTVSLLQSTLNSTADGILVVDSAGKIVSFNERFVSLWQIPQGILDSRDDEAALGFVVSQLKNPDVFLRKVYELYENPDAESFDILEFKDGRVVERYSRPQRLDGVPIGRVWSFRDDTERKRAEEELRGKTVLFEAQLNSSVDGILVVDSQGKKIIQNQRTIDLWKIPQNIVDENDDEKQVQFVMNRTKNPQQFVEKVVYLYSHPNEISQDEIELKDGTILDRYSSPIIGKDGKHYGRIWSFHDITERKRAEEMSATQQRLLDGLITAIPDLIYFKDRESRFIRINEAYAERAGLTNIQAALGKTDFDIFGEEHARQAYEDEQQIIVTGQPMINKEERENWPDGRVTWATSTKLPLFDSNGKIVGIMGISRDITERKQAENKLAHERQLLRTLIDLLPEIFYVKDMESRFLMANEALAKSFGKDNYSQILGLSDADFFPAERAAIFRAEEKKVLAGEPLIDHEENVIFPDGRKYTLLTTKVPFHDSQGRICGLVGIGRDFTERKRSEETIANERQLLRTLIDLLPETFHVKDMDSRFLMVNEALAKRFGKDNYSQVLGLSDADFFPPEKAAMYRAEEQKILAGEPLIDHEGMVCFPDGREYMLMTSKVPFRDVQGRICGLVGIGRDITERKRAEEQLRESERKYRELVEHANSIIIRWTPDGRITFINEFGQKFFGYSAEEIIGRHVIGTIVPETESTNRDLRPMVNQISTDPKSFEQNINENQRRDGQRVWVAWTNKAVFDEQGQVKEILSIGSDITERKKLEEQFRQSQKMEAIGQLSGGVAHDFNNILTVIQGNASLLLNAQLKSDEKSECSMQIIRAAERAADLTRQLLMFSRKQVMQLADLNLNDAVKQMTKMLQRILGEDITLQSNYAPDLPPIHADAGMVEQVLLNLVVNARDAMPGGGRLTIITGVEMVDEKQAQQNPGAKAGLHVRLTVTDTGCGIAPEILPRIFEPFFTTKEIGKGTGLGLATVYGIVHQHHGWVTVNTDINKGTTFRIYFPALAGATLPKKSASIVSQFARGTETVLVVEDEPPVRLLVNNLLQRCGYHVLQAESGVAALKVWQAHKDEIQLLLTDIVMPDNMTGLELAGRLQMEKPKLKIIYTSGYSGDVAGKDVALVEGVNFLKKPYQPEKLARILRKNLDQN